MESGRPEAERLAPNSFRPGSLHQLALSAEEQYAHQSREAGEQQVAASMSLRFAKVDDFWALVPLQESSPHQPLQVLLVPLHAQDVNPPLLCR